MDYGTCYTTPVQRAGQRQRQRVGNNFDKLAYDYEKLLDENQQWQKACDKLRAAWENK